MTLDGIVEKEMKKLKETRKKLGIKQAVYISDVHVPFEDKKANKALELFLKEQQPEYLIYGGDIVDFYSVSRFDKDPERKFNLQDEITQGQLYLTRMNAASPDSKKYFLEGNHENRIVKYLTRNPELAGLNVLSLDSLLGLSRRGIDFVPYDKGLVLHNFLFKHGTRANLHSAKAELEMENYSGMSGHIHRVQRYSKTDRHGTHTWHTVGHLSDITQIDYFNQHVPNWQVGFGVVEFYTKQNLYDAQQIIINNGKFLYRGRVYGSRK